MSSLNHPSIAHLGDCMNPETGLPSFPDKWFDLAVVDPPYGIGYSELVGFKKTKHGFKKRNSSKWDSSPPEPEYFEELFRASKAQIIFGGNYFALPPTRCFLIWDKVQRIDQADCELAWTSFNESARIFSYARGNESGFAPMLSESQKQFANIHSCQKPIALYDWIYSRYAKPGMKVCDTHLGSGSNRIAAYKAGMDFTAWELDPDYFKAQEERFRKFLIEHGTPDPSKAIPGQQINLF